MTDYQWWDCGCGFKCPYCGHLMVADSDDWSECECGAKYMIDSRLVTKRDGTVIKVD